MTEEEKKKEVKLSDEDKCRIAFEIALDEAMSICKVGPGTKKEAAKAIGTILGLDEAESEKVANGYEEILKEPLTKEQCYDFRAIRRRAMAFGWKRYESERIPFREAIKKGWSDVKSACKEIGAII
jgi:hypothetical protein